MKQRVFVLGACVLAMGSAYGADKLAVKTGQWEMTYTSKVEGNVVPKEMLDKVPPERRAQIEQAMAAHSAASAQAHVSKTCVTEKDLTEAAFDKDTDANCKRTMISRTATHQEMSIECTRDGRAQKGHMTVDAPSNERIQGTMELLVNDGKVLSDFSGKWLGATCTTDTAK